MFRTLCSSSLVAIILFVSSSSFASQYGYTNNMNLDEQWAGQDYRVLPKLDDTTMGINGFLFKPFVQSEYIDQNDYHGNGYWVDVFAEFRQIEDVEVNLKLTLYNGTSSFGYSQASYVHNLVGVSWKPRLLENVHTFGRYFDLGRQTFASGLLLDNVEMSGALGEIYNDWLRLKIVINGSGGYFTTGDLYYGQIDLWKNIIGIHWEQNFRDKNDIEQTSSGGAVLVDQADPTYGLFSHYEWFDGFKSFLEYTAERDGEAGLAKLTYDQTFGDFTVNLVGQYRRYEDEFLGEYVRITRRAYMTPEHWFLPYTDFLNIYQVDDNVTVGSGEINVTWKFHDQYEFESLNEFGTFDYEDADEKDEFHFWRNSFVHYPVKGKPHKILLYVANKTLYALGNANSVQAPPNPMFFETDVWGLDAYFFF
jgi:hypothetical protein